ncbi:MAG: ABC transporter permease [Actinobacteria bacterium]|jgi:peptide/nickel transport system permease protein|nr:ABC transporter permease [Actinomycetota bacterium]NCW90871.1 ABC transporter permease [Acidimicrobiia bacterium]NCV09143.1 ABC transporter permease [Actinomycetota bacterium]NCX36812.1 ABC transporter permease [Actinomycetota bacterium]NDA53669.1 ABC transporter permease [Actinomycetota bacterium]
MVNYLVKRVLNFLMMVILASTLGYVLASVAFDPSSNYQGANPPIPQSTIDAKLDNLGVNPKTPLVRRYVDWVGNALQGDFGLTIGEQRVNEELSRRIWVSLRLLVLGSIIGSLAGVALGVFSAVRQYGVTDRAASVLSFSLLSTPVFLLAILLKFGAIDLNNRLGTTFFYTIGEYSADFSGNGWELLINRLQHLILPTMSIALGGIAFYSRYQRNAMLDVLGSDFLRTARAKGLSRRQSLFRHGLRVAILPMATFFAYSFGLLVTGAPFTESIFGWNGMGSWFITAVQSNDINSVSAVIVFSSVLVLLSGLLADVAVAALDPRVRLR